VKGELDGRERAEDIRHFCRGLVEEAEGPELCKERNGKDDQSGVKGEGRRGKERDAHVQHEGHLVWIRLCDAVA
jgi:hypothetical protein